MKRIIICLAIMLNLFVVIQDECQAEWTKYDTLREVTWQTLHFIDWGQTRNIAKDLNNYYERNPIIGKHPSIGEVDTYMITSALVHVGISMILPEKYRRIFQYTSIGVSTYCVITNHHIGLRMKF